MHQLTPPIFPAESSMTRANRVFTRQVAPSPPPKLGVSTLIINAKLPGYKGLQQLWVDARGIVQGVQPMDYSFRQVPPENLQVLNLQREWLSLGGVDLQINGALGLPFPDVTRNHHETLTEIGQFLWTQGLEAFLPTLVTTSIDNIQRTLASLHDFMSLSSTTQSPSAQILGVHLEGPFLNPAKRGAHPEQYLRPLTVDEVKRVLGDYTELVRVITLAPELDPDGKVIPYLRSLGIVVSLGHSQATAEEAKLAFSQGATMVTHAFNAMPSLHHREPGLLGAALLNPQVYCGFIADGHHVCPMMLDLLLRAIRNPKSDEPTKRVFLVSDALAPFGLSDGIYPWDDRQMSVQGKTAFLPDGTLVGTTLPLLSGVQNLVRWNVCEVEEAIALATDNPNHALGKTFKFKRHQCQYVGRSVDQLLRWRFHEPSRKLTWQRLQPAVNPISVA